MNAIALNTFLGNRQRYFPRSCDLSTVELGVPRVHYESLHSVELLGLARRNLHVGTRRARPGARCRGRQR
ncbi:hypothetical protein Mycsm_06928 (plasmid) [Mycobacterium sp. JS623]|uniref:hypothetical protein n=1 Tax=Mycobacterium sp. JS623 TaxID=212767 RepID=UPI0002A5A32D|nr:hypothetical protein [Mycobacterium sp. JS623]AGB27031.1 hypothetical protein Mycsm_06928 [Mycobacterium sp. JS623]